MAASKGHVGQPGALVGAAGDADDLAALDLGDLPGDGAGGAGGAGDGDRVARLWPPHVQHAEIGGQAGDAQHAQEVRKWLHTRLLHQGLSWHCDVFLPAAIAERQVPRPEIRVVGTRLPRPPHAPTLLFRLRGRLGKWRPASRPGSPHQSTCRASSAKLRLPSAQE